MKRRSQPREPKRDRELEQLKQLTTVTLTQSAFRARLLADKTALEMRLREVFAFRRFMSFPKGGLGERECDEIIAHISRELRHVKAQLKQQEE